MKELKDTVALMTSADYKERFAAEYYQLETRYLKLLAMCEKWDKGELNFTPTCSRETYAIQLHYMHEYLDSLITRAILENVDIEADEVVRKELDENSNPNNIIRTKLLRKYLDNKLVELRTLKPCREVNIAITKIQEGIMWLGMNLKHLREKDPYANSNDVTTTIIDKTADNLKMKVMNVKEFKDIVNIKDLPDNYDILITCGDSIEQNIRNIEIDHDNGIVNIISE